MWKTLTSNYIINVGFLSWMIAQLLKTLITLFLTKQVRLERLIGSGGMPSSHSALATSVAVAMLQKTGYNSPEFALAAAFALIVMYDAMGVRRAAGEQAKILNRIVFELPELPRFRQEDSKAYVEAPLDHDKKEETSSTEKEETETSKPIADKRLKELLGHTPFEVLGGMVLGIVIALIVPVK